MELISLQLSIYYFERKSGLPGTYTWDTFTRGNPQKRKQEAFGYENNLNDDSAHLLYVPSGLNDPNVCWGSCAGAPDLVVANEVLDLLYNQLKSKKVRRSNSSNWSI